MKTYYLHNPETSARIKCDEKHLLEWVARGFEVESIENVEVEGTMYATQSTDEV